MTQNLNVLIENYYRAREGAERAKAEASRLEELKKHRERDLINAMLAAHTKSVKLEDGTTVSLVNHVGCSCTQENFDAIREWLVEETGDDADFVKEVVDKSTLLEFVKSYVEKGAAPDDFPEFLNVSTFPGLSVRGWKNR